MIQLGIFIYLIFLEKGYCRTFEKFIEKKREQLLIF